MENPQNKYRYERKYKLSVNEYDALLHKLHVDDTMKIHHPSRYINNVYFDNFSMDSYNENVEGESKRDKYRLRWYGDKFSIIKPTFEVKMKLDQVNKKESIKLKTFNFRNHYDIENLYNHVLDELNVLNPKLYLNFINKSPTLINRYERNYFISNDEKVRLTIDKNVEFYNCINHQSHKEFESIIVEVKYATNITPKINFKDYKLILGKNSKYVSGLNYTKL